MIHVWLAITEILKRVEAALSKIRPSGGGGERSLAIWRNLIAFLIVSKVTGRFSYSVSELVNFDFGLITPSLVGEVWNLAKAEMGGTYGALWPRSAVRRGLLHESRDSLRDRGRCSSRQKDHPEHAQARADREGRGPKKRKDVNVWHAR